MLPRSNRRRRMFLAAYCLALTAGCALYFLGAFEGGGRKRPYGFPVHYMSKMNFLKKWFENRVARAGFNGSRESKASSGEEEEDYLWPILDPDCSNWAADIEGMSENETRCVSQEKHLKNVLGDMVLPRKKSLVNFFLHIAGCFCKSGRISYQESGKTPHEPSWPEVTKHNGMVPRQLLADSQVLERTEDCEEYFRYQRTLSKSR